MVLFHQFNKHITEHLSFLKDKKLLLALSGGVDSVVLANLCVQLKLDVAFAHCNFNLRAEESDTDEAFVTNLANQLNTKLFVKLFNTKHYAEQHKLSIQLAARELRYNWFYELAEQFQFDYILTAHHADDALETFLINLSRGTGLQGLTGIPEINHKTVRPLLPFSRDSIVAFAKQTHLKWREDSSNASTKYMRNALRHNVIPNLKKSTPQFLAHFQNTLEYLNASQQILTAHISNVVKSCITKQEGQTIYFDVLKLKQLQPQKAYLYHIFNSYQFTDWKAISNLLHTQSGKQVFSATHSLTKHRGFLIVSKLQKTEFTPVLIFENTQKISINNSLICIDEVKKIQEIDSSVIFVDKSKIKYPLKIRKWQKGDYFCPFGMQGSKKLSKYFKDEKLSVIDKENILLLCSDNNIVWVINYRLDNRFKVSNTTNSILRISCNT